MYSPSDFNTDVPPFDNGSYASQPLNPQYVEAPDSENYVRGTEPLQTLPAQWWNWLCNQFTGKFNGVNKYVKNLFTELSNLLSLMGITPSEPTVPTGTQLSTGFLNNYPNVISKFIHTVASIWSYTGTTVVGDVTTTQTTKLAVFEHINESDASTTPATETDTYNTKYVDQLPVKLGGTDSDNANGAMINLVSPLSKVASGSGSINDMVVFDRLNTGGTHTVAKMDLNELGRIVSQSFINTPVITTNTNVINNVALQFNDQLTIFFTGDIIGANTTTPLEIVYNSVNIPVRATKNGALTPVYAHDIYDGTVHTYKFLQAYTALNLIYDGTFFVIIGNPVVLSDTDYVIYADGFNEIEFANNQNELSDWYDFYEYNNNSWTMTSAPYDGFITAISVGGQNMSVKIEINDTITFTTGTAAAWTQDTLVAPFKKGDKIKLDPYGSFISQGYVCFYEKRTYVNR